MSLLETHLSALFLLLGIIVPSHGLTHQLGDSLNPLQNSRWVSDNQEFAFGFVDRGSKNYSLSIYYDLQRLNSTVVWTVLWGQTISSNASLVLGKDGNLVLTDGGTQIWQTNTGNQGVTSAKISDAGALVLLDNASNAVWQNNQSFTDTLLRGQALPADSMLVSEQGKYALWMQNDSNMVLYFLGSLAGGGDGGSVGLAYESSRTYSGNLSAILDNDGNFKLVNPAGSTVKTILSTGTPTPHLIRLQLTVWGLLRLYGWNEGETSWTLYAQSPANPCAATGVCGPYGVCNSSSYQIDLYSCECPQGFRPVDNDTFAFGCMPVIPFDFSSGIEFLTLPGIQYSQFSLVSYYFENPPTVATGQACMEACYNSYQCMAAQFSPSGCYLKTLGQIHSGNILDANAVAYLKVSVSASSGSNDSWAQGSSTATNLNHAAHLSKAAIAVITTVSVLVATLTLVNAVCFYVMRKNRRYEQIDSEGTEESSAYNTIPGAPIKFSYRQLQGATNGFREKLGGGGFGSVYKGILAGGSAVAVKQLESVNQGLKQFQAEVATIGGIHHINLVRLRGFCAEGFRKLLVYDFMPNGSLDRYLFSSARQKHPSFTLDWNTRFSVACGTAKAISYLHEECEPSIIHCDIKPENILLDVDYSPKVCDFGLAKLIGGDIVGSITTVRGTIGYMAPEWICSSHITVKADVYSYGIVLLEMLSGKRNPRDVAPRDTSFTYSEWAYGQLKTGNFVELLDPVLEGQADRERVERIAKVAFWCIQKDQNSRPTMQKVIQMLDGTITVSLPPPSFDISSNQIPHTDSGGNDLPPANSGRDDISVLLEGR